MTCWSPLTVSADGHRVPFLYSLQARYLVSYPVDLSLLHLAVIVAVQLLGTYTPCLIMFEYSSCINEAPTVGKQNRDIPLPFNKTTVFSRLF